jgi:hypothetical protein
VFVLEALQCLLVGGGVLALPGLGQGRRRETQLGVEDVGHLCVCVCVYVCMCVCDLWGLVMLLICICNYHLHTLSHNVPAPVNQCSTRPPLLPQKSVPVVRFFSAPRPAGGPGGNERQKQDRNIPWRRGVAPKAFPPTMYVWCVYVSEREK